MFLMMIVFWGSTLGPVLEKYHAGLGLGRPA